MMKVNPILAIDAYKFGHMSMHPKVIDYVYGNLPPRSTKLTLNGIQTLKIKNMRMIQDCIERKKVLILKDLKHQHKYMI